MAHKRAVEGVRDTEKPASNECQRALKKLKEVVLEGLRHGYFEYSVACEVQKGKRRLVIKAGVSHQFYISQEELDHTS